MLLSFESKKWLRGLQPALRSTPWLSTAKRRQQKDYIWKREHRNHSYNLWHEGPKRPSDTCIRAHTRTCPVLYRRRDTHFVRPQQGLHAYFKKHAWILANACSRLAFWLVAHARTSVSLCFPLYHSLLEMVEFHLGLRKDWWAIMFSPHNSSLHHDDSNKPKQNRCKKFLKAQLILGVLIQQNILWCCMWKALCEINCTTFN